MASGELVKNELYESGAAVKNKDNAQMKLKSLYHFPEMNLNKKRPRFGLAGQTKKTARGAAVNRRINQPVKRSSVHGQ
ncbi:MAG: hypothetical protein IKI41_08400 [Clostridia bacterium]|nr:hypothetical protein [Clostridia bacterium]